MTAVLHPGITLLEASAGTGKTFRIAHMVLRLVAEEGFDVGSVVVVTFTEAATGELRDRVRRRLRDALEGLDARAASRTWRAPDQVLGDWVSGASQDQATARRRRLRGALVDFDQALIATIHGFCNTMLRRNAFESGASFGAEVVAGVEDLLDDLALDFWSRLVHDAHPSLFKALGKVQVTRKRLRDLAGKAADLDREIVPPPPPGADLGARLPDLTAWQAAFDRLDRAWGPSDVWTALSDGSVTVHSKRKGYDASFPRSRTLDRAWSVRRRLNGARPWPHDELPTALRYFEPARIEAGTYDGQQPPEDEPLAAMAAFLAEHDAVQPTYAAVVLGLKFAFVQQVRQRLKPLARGRNLRTYHDLLVDLRDALRRTGGTGGALQQAVRGRYQVALIDEFQDTDPIQWEVFRTLFPDRLCLIGDPKQAIYSFRGADVFTYRQAEGSVGQRRDLDTNFRTDRPLVDAVVQLFDRDEPFGAPDPPCPAVASRWAGRRLSDVPAGNGAPPGPDPRPPLEIRLLPRAGADTNASGWLAWGFMNERMPGVVADDVALELDEGRHLQVGGEWRPVRPGDCAVLTRTNDQAAAVQRELRARGIPSVIKSTDPVLGSPEAGDLAAVLDAVVHPADAGAVRRALVTPLMGRTAGTLVSLERDPASFEAEVEPFWRWHAAWTEHGFARMFRSFLDEDEVRARLLARSGGERALTNLVHLGEELTRASTERRLGPAGLQSWLAAGGPGSDPDATGQRLESDADAVRVSTMHSAKGLEWPLVWCPYLWQTFSVGRGDAVHLVFHDPDDGLKAKVDIGSVRHDEHLRRAKMEKFQEELRMVYVALTRARHRTVAYHGAANSRSSLGYLLHERRTSAADFIKYGSSRMKRDDEMDQDVMDLVSSIPGLAATKVLWTGAPVPAYDPEPVGSSVLAARELTRDRPPDVLWRRTSFSALVRRGVEVRDRDDEASSEAGETSAPEASDEAPARDPRPVVLGPELRGGRGTGNLLHKIFELHDFQGPGRLKPLVREQLVSRGFDEALTERVSEGLQLAIDTPMGDDGVRLADLARSRRLDELDFVLPVHGGFEPGGGLLTASKLAAAFQLATNPGWADRIGRLSFTHVRGFMSGAIDLVFEHGGRWFVVDYKSNWLGERYGDYERSRLAEPMVEASYVLQYHLYTLAVHRYLRWRIGTDTYDYDAHFGGVRYLFVRGMRPDLGPTHGVFADRPPRSMIEELDQAIGGAP